MSHVGYRQYGKYLNEIIAITFEDKKIQWTFLYSLVALVIGITTHISIPFCLKKIVESFSSNQDGLFITLVLLSYGFVWILNQAFLHIRALLTYSVEQRITYTLGVKVLTHLYTLPLSYFTDQKSGALMNVIRRAQRNVPSLILGLFFHIIPTVIEFLFVVFFIYLLYPITYSLLMFGILVTFYIYTSARMQALLKARAAANEVDENADGTVADWLSNFESIKIFGRQKFAIDICKDQLKKREKSELNFLKKYSFSHLGQSLIMGFGLSVFTLLVGYDVFNGSLKVGDFVLFNGYLLQFITPVVILGQVTQDMKKAFIDMKGIIHIFLLKNEVCELPSPTVLSASDFELEFDNVSFKYNDRTILEKVSFKIAPGETTLIVGPTGSGKSTIAKLLLRLYDPTEGSIFINKTNLKDISFKSLHETVGLIPQETCLLNDSIRNNLLFIHPEATSDDIEQALACAHLLEYIKTLPKGIDTMVGDKGLKLSGGEKQRFSLARLFLKKPKICIFDENTSSLDRHTETIIQNNVEIFFPNLTKIIITHRPFTFYKHKIDQVITLNNRSVVYEKIMTSTIETKIYAKCD